MNYTKKRNIESKLTDHFHLFEQFAELALDLVQASLNGIVYSLEAKDEYSSQHSKRVASMVNCFSTVLQMNSFDKKLITITASVHDIGKIGIPDSILLKSSPLSEEEWAIMKTHSNIGADILKKTGEAGIDIKPNQLVIPTALSKKLFEMEEGIRHHHEKWNGQGYPLGLKEEEIPLFSRIIALCDSVDAMMSQRRYRNALPPSVCKEEIKKNSAIMYDPTLTTLLLNHWDEIVTPQYKTETIT